MESNNYVIHLSPLDNNIAWIPIMFGTSCITNCYLSKNRLSLCNSIEFTITDTNRVEALKEALNKMFQYEEIADNINAITAPIILTVPIIVKTKVTSPEKFNRNIIREREELATISGIKYFESIYSFISTLDQGALKAELVRGTLLPYFVLTETPNYIINGNEVTSICQQCKYASFQDQTICPFFTNNLDCILNTKEVKVMPVEEKKE